MKRQRVHWPEVLPCQTPWSLRCCLPGHATIVLDVPRIYQHVASRKYTSACTWWILISWQMDQKHSKGEGNMPGFMLIPITWQNQKHSSNFNWNLKFFWFSGNRKVQRTAVYSRLLGHATRNMFDLFQTGAEEHEHSHHVGVMVVVTVVVPNVYRTSIAEWNCLETVEVVHHWIATL